MNSLDTVSVTNPEVTIPKKEPKKEPKKKIPMGLLREFQEKHRKIYILTTRYNTKTLLANRTFLESSGKYKCVYSSPASISEKIPTGSKCVVLEMNNDTNRIIGIGLIEKTECKKKLWIQEWGNYNRVHYSGYYRIDRSDSGDSNSNIRETKLMELLDLLCFKGSGHLKRGKGLTMFPVSYLYSYFEKGVDIELEIREMFNRRFSVDSPHNPRSSS